MVLLTEKSIFITRAKGKEVFPETCANFFKIALERGRNLVRFAVIKDGFGDALFEIYR